MLGDGLERGTNALLIGAAGAADFPKCLRSRSRRRSRREPRDVPKLKSASNKRNRSAQREELVQ